jgi:diguanylate cyclase (GGDEF)-like protein/PAS domain S-box-containing protein
LLTIALTSAVLAVTLGAIGIRHTHDGTLLWALGIALHAIAFVLFLLRPQVGDLISIVGANTLIAASLVVLTAGCLWFQGRRLVPWLLWLPLPVTVFANLYWIHDLRARVLANGLVVLFQGLVLLAILLRGRQASACIGRYIVAAGVSMVIMALVLRVLGVWSNPDAVRSLTSAGPVQTTTFLASLNGLILLVIGVIVMVRERLEANLRLSEQRFRTYVESAHDIVYTLDMQGRFKYLSPNLQDVLGYAPAELLNQHFAVIVHPDDLPACEAFLQRLLDGGKKLSGLEYRVRHRDGDWHWHLTNGSPLFDDAGHIIAMLGLAHDISERKASEVRISYLAHHDALTDLPNRTLLLDRLQQALQDAERQGTQGALLFIDLDGFKPINDTHGHGIGDQVLQVVAARLRAAVRASDSVGRIGGDEFLVLLPRIACPSAALMVADQINRALREPIQVDGLHLAVSCSVGVAVYPRHGRDAITLVRHADEAMYSAKQGGRDRVSLAEPNLAQ